jgi:L-ascorbate metabolism protein UlaG (beta-lactamase superfamily)
VKRPAVLAFIPLSEIEGVIHCYIAFRKNNSSFPLLLSKRSNRNANILVQRPPYRKITDLTMTSLLLEIEEPSSHWPKLTLWGLSGAGFVLRYQSDVVYIDPWLVPPDTSRTTHRTFPIPFTPENAKKVSAILSTHEHEDHCNVPTLSGLNKSTKAKLYGPISVFNKATKGGFPLRSIQTVAPRDILNITNEITVRVFQAHDPYEEHAVMFLIETPRGTIFHSGDSAYFDGFKRIGNAHKVDVALLNFGKQIPSPEKPYYMNAEKLALAARDLDARIVVPMHWNLWVETREDPSPIRNTLSSISPNSKLTVIEGGQKLEL